MFKPNPSKIEENAYFDMILRRVHLALLGVIGFLSLSVVGLVIKIYKTEKLESVYVLAPDQTIVARRADETLVRSEYEIIGFVRNFIEKVFNNDKYSFRDNLKKATEWMDEKSVHTLLSAMVDAKIEETYLKANASSSVSIGEVVMDKNLKTIVIDYQINLRFLEIDKTVYENEEVEGKMYIELAFVKRGFENPYGMQIRDLKFLPLKDNKN